MTQLCKGIFWITDTDDLENNDLLFLIPATPDGAIIDPIDLNLNSKHGDNYNHKLFWASLPQRVTHGRSFDFYPRGRVEIKRGKATIYANPSLCTDEVRDFLVERFGLTPDNGITSVRMNADGSEHYKCNEDR